MRLGIYAFVLYAAVTATVSSAGLRRAVQFSQAREVTRVNDGALTEVSGICASRIHTDVLYVHNDSGDYNRIFAISATTGQLLATLTIDGAHAQDWEDIACGPCPGGNGHCIYVADTGGNAGGDSNTIYRIREPASLHSQHVNVESALKFSWDQHDCESVMVDPKGELYIISKVSPGHHGKLVHLPSNLWGDQHHIRVNSGVYLSITASSNSPVAADISPSGNEVLVKTYGHVYYYEVGDGDYYSHLTRTPVALPYRGERQGEAVCWDTTAHGFYTLSEGSNQPLYYHRRESALLPVG